MTGETDTIVGRATQAVIDECIRQHREGSLGWVDADDADARGIVVDGLIDPAAIARAVMAAMREPSARMISDGAFQIFRGERITDDDAAAAKRVWRAMSKTALSE